MQMIFRKYPPLGPLLALFLFLAQAGVSSAAGLRAFITTDVHGYAVAEPEKGRIGYALLKGYIQEAEDQGVTTFLLDSGDAFSGSAYAQIDYGRSVAALMGLMGYRALTPGNHAFDHNRAEKDPQYYSNVLLKAVRQKSAAPVFVLAANLSRNGETVPATQREPVLLYDETPEDPDDSPRLIVAGVITPYTARPSLSESIPGYDFGRIDGPGGRDDPFGPAATRQKILGELTAALRPYNHPQDIVIVLSHIGYSDPGGRITGPDLAKVPNVDFVTDGHSHKAVAPQAIGSAVYANGGRYLENFLEIDVPENGPATMRLRGAADMAGIQPDPAISAFLDEVSRQQGMDDILFTLTDDAFSDRNLKTGNIPLGRLLCRTMLRLSGADLAVHSAGGIRAGLGPGRVTARDIYDAAPFGDDLAEIPLTGQEIGELFALWAEGGGRGPRGLPQFYGMAVYAWKDAAGRLKIAGILDASGAPLDPATTYKVAFNSFMLRNLALSGREKQEYTNHGDLTSQLVNWFRHSPDPALDSLRSNRTLRVFSDKTEAEAAWRTAAR